MGPENHIGSLLGHTYLILQLFLLVSASSMMVMEDLTSMDTLLGWFFWISLYILHRK
jgi:hypothetical protein